MQQPNLNAPNGGDEIPEVGIAVHGEAIAEKLEAVLGENRFWVTSVVSHTAKSELNVCGPQVSRLRVGLGWSQPQLAAKCQIAGWDVSRDIIARIELKKRWVGDFELAILAQVLNVPLNELFPARYRKLLS